MERDCTENILVILTYIWMSDILTTQLFMYSNPKLSQTTGNGNGIYCRSALTETSVDCENAGNL